METYGLVIFWLFNCT